LGFYDDIVIVTKGNITMKKMNILMAPLFAAVVMLLSIGAVGELFVSLFAKVKSLVSTKSTASQSALEGATQLH